jgi:hypothetical protein
MFIESIKISQESISKSLKSSFEIVVFQLQVAQTRAIFSQ